jgi:3-hydroxyacyl-[acyl-carrier-protein] dehydratase
MDLILPLDYAAIERILPHRFPFLLVDRIIEFEVDKRIVGIKNVSLNDPYLSHATGGGAPALPPTILTEAIAQVGAILILAKPENRQRLPLFAGIVMGTARRAERPEILTEPTPAFSSGGLWWSRDQESRAVLAIGHASWPRK